MLLIRLFEWLKSKPRLLPTVKAVIREDLMFVVSLMGFVMFLDYLR